MNQVPRRQKARRAIALVSLLLFPLTLYYLSPAVIVIGASEGLLTGSAILFSALFLFSLALGRSFCSWLCPAGTLQDCAARVNDRPLRGKRVDLVKYLIWIPWLGLIVLLLARAGGIAGIDPLYMTDHGVSVSGLYSYIPYYAVLAIFLLCSFLGRRRLACHALCWMAPFMVIGTRIKDALPLPSLRLKARSGACSGCKSCERRCPMSLPVATMVARSDMRADECILCGECADGCPTAAIGFAWTARTREEDR